MPFAWRLGTNGVSVNPTAAGQNGGEELNHMQWYFVENGQQAGPVEEIEIPQLLSAGRLRADTLVWHEGMGNWEPFRNVCPPEFHANLGSPTTPPTTTASENEAVCAECGKVFNKEDMIPHGNVRICAQCKPIFMQKLAEGVAVAKFLGENLTEQQILDREYKIDIGSALSRAWDAFKNNAGMVIGGLVLIGLTFLGCWAISAVVSIVIPFGNAVLGILYSVPLLVGVYWLMLKAIRGEQPQIADGFVGIKSHYTRLLLFSLIQFLCNLICFVPIMVVALGFGLTMSTNRGANPGIGLVLTLVSVMLVAVCAWVYVYMHLYFAALLIIDKRYPAWQAVQLSRKMVRRRWWMTFAFGFVAYLITMVGALACFVGMLASVPVAMGMKSALYDDNFRDLKPYN